MSDENDMSEVRRTAVHEAGHAIAAHAVGRRVVKLRCIPKELMASDPENPYGHPFFTYGFHQAEPLLGDDVVVCLRANLPLPSELREWCLQDAIICLGGPIAEGTLGHDRSSHDVEEWAKSARALNGVAAGQPLRSFYEATVYAAQLIVSELREPLDALVDQLFEEGEMDQQKIQKALTATRRGSHRHLLNTLM